MSSGTNKTRVTQHSGRHGHAAHNDRSWYATHDVDPEHINKDRSQYNRQFTWLDHLDNAQRDAVLSDPDVPTRSSDTGRLEYAEQVYYNHTFSDALNIQNEKYATKGNHDRIRDMNDWMESYDKRPEEVLLQIGDMHDNVDPKVLTSVFGDYLKNLEQWNNDHGGPYQILDAALHVDESTPHIHLRRVWQYRDQDGNMAIGQDKALEQAGVELPDPSKPRSRYNNRKMTYDRMMRDKLLDIAERHGVDVERVPIPDQRSEMLSDYVRRQEAERRNRERELEDREADLQRRERVISVKESQIRREQVKSKEYLGKADMALYEAQELLRDVRNIPAAVQKKVTKVTAVKNEIEMMSPTDQMRMAAADLQDHGHSSDLQYD